MTQPLIEQRSGHDCVLAAIAMAAGKTAWHDLWTDEDLERVVREGGVKHEAEWLVRAGLGERDRDWRFFYIHADTQHMVRAMLWGRRALLAVHSLNIDHGQHMIYWDGERVLDPSTQTKFKFLHSAVISELIIFRLAP